MKELILTKDKVALVDDEDFEYLNQWKWTANRMSGKWYAYRNKRINGKCNMIYLHRQIMNTPEGLYVDHKDRDGLNCQKSNMRNCTQSQNMMNSDCKSQNKGVCVNWCKTKFTAKINVGKAQIHLGCFDTEVEAAKAYNKAALKYFGEYARLNTFSEEREVTNINP
jgi:hypothetical protein